MIRLSIIYFLRSEKRYRTQWPSITISCNWEKNFEKTQKKTYKCKLEEKIATVRRSRLQKKGEFLAVCRESNKTFTTKRT